MKAVLVFVVLVVACGAVAEAGRAKWPAFYPNSALRLGTHTTTIKMKECYDAYSRMILCRLKGVTDEEKAAMRQVGMKINPKEMKRVTTVCDETDDPRKNPTRGELGYQFTYSLLRSLSKTSMVWNAYWAANDKNTQYTLDSMVMMLLYNVLAAGSYEADTATPGFTEAAKFLADTKNFEQWHESKKLDDNKIPIGTTLLRKHLLALISSPTFRVTDCRRVAYRLKSMEVATDLSVEEARARAQLIKTITGVINGLLSAGVGTAVGAFGGPAAGAAASATVNIVGKLVDSFVSAKLQSKEQKGATFQVILTYFSALVEPEPKIDSKEVAHNALIRGMGSLHRDITSLSYKVAEILRRNPKRFRSMRFRQIESKVYALDKKGPTEACTTAQADDCACTTKVKHLLAILRAFFEDEPASGGKSTVAALESCTPISQEHTWWGLGSDYKEADHNFVIKNLFKISNVFMSTPDPSSVTVAESTFQNFYKDGGLEAIGDGIKEVGTAAYEDYKDKQEKATARKEAIYDLRETNPGKSDKELADIYDKQQKEKEDAVKSMTV